MEHTSNLYLTELQSGIEQGTLPSEGLRSYTIMVCRERRDGPIL